MKEVVNTDPLPLSKVTQTCFEIKFLDEYFLFGFVSHGKVVAGDSDLILPLVIEALNANSKNVDALLYLDDLKLIGRFSFQVHRDEFSFLSCMSEMWLLTDQDVLARVCFFNCSSHSAVRYPSSGTRLAILVVL